MKKLVAAAVILLSVCLVSCKSGFWSDEEIIQEAVNDYNKECPQIMDNGSSLTKVFIEGQDIVFQIDVFDEPKGHTVADIDTLAYKAVGMKSIVTESQYNNYLRSLCESLQEVDYEIIYRYVGKISGATTEIHFSPAEILAEIK